MFEGTAKQAVLVSADLDSVVIASTASRITMLVISCTVLPVELLVYQFPICETTIYMDFFGVLFTGLDSRGIALQASSL